MSLIYGAHGSFFTTNVVTRTVQLIIYLPTLKLDFKLVSDFCDYLERWESQYKVYPIQQKIFSHHPGGEEEMQAAKQVKKYIVQEVYIRTEIKYLNKHCLRGDIP